MGLRQTSIIILLFLFTPGGTKYLPVSCCISVGDFIPDAIDRCIYWRCVYTGERDVYGNYILKPQKKICPIGTAVYLEHAIGPSSPFVEWVYWYVRGRHKGICGENAQLCVRNTPLKVYECSPVTSPKNRCYDCTYEVGLAGSFQACSFSNKNLIQQVATPGCRSGKCFIRRVHDSLRGKIVITRGCLDRYFGQSYQAGCVNYPVSVQGTSDVRIYCSGDLCNNGTATGDNVDPVDAVCGLS